MNGLMDRFCSIRKNEPTYDLPVTNILEITCYFFTCLTFFSLVSIVFGADLKTQQLLIRIVRYPKLNAQNLNVKKVQFNLKPSRIFE